MKPRGVFTIAAVLIMVSALSGCGTRPDSVSAASLLVSAEPARVSGILPGRPVIITPAERGGAARLAAAIAARLGASVVSPASVTMEEIEGASLIGFGSGIFDQVHHASLLELAEALPSLPGRRVFIFSTSGISRETAMAPDLHEDDPHKALRERLTAKGCEIVGEFNCVGYNDNSFLFLFGGINKGHPDANDIGRAEVFSDSLLQGGGA